MQTWIAVSFGVAVLALCLRMRGLATMRARAQLRYLCEDENQRTKLEGRSAVAWSEAVFSLSYLSDRLGKAGFFSRQERAAQHAVCGCVVVGAVLLGGLAGARGGVVAMCAGCGVGAYLGVVCWLYYLRYRVSEVERRVLFELPLLLESVILLVEAGMGVLPALQQIVSVEDPNGTSSPVLKMFRIVYELSAHGMPFALALETIAETVHIRALRHVLLHLDISSSEGGSLVPSLRSLSDHAHTEWTLSVQHRVKRLENLAVFPVFVAVLGLLVLTAAVPLVPIIEFSNSLHQAPDSATETRTFGGGTFRPQEQR